MWPQAAVLSRCRHLQFKKLVDTTGAGDLFAAGFLFGMALVCVAHREKPLLVGQFSK
jgi:hypothetical protein